MTNRNKWTTHKDLKADLLKDPKFKREFKNLEAEFQIARQIVDARMKQKMSQQELARRAKTGQAVISRLESMNSKPSLSLLEKVARALNTKISLVIQ